MDPSSQSPESGTLAHSLLAVIFVAAAAFALAFAAGTALVEVLGRPWRRAGSAHWTERARLAYAPGSALLWLAMVLPPVLALVGAIGIMFLNPQGRAGWLEFWGPWLAALCGALMARYRWLREWWGTRVTLRSWLAGCLVLLFVIGPHFHIMGLFLLLLPDEPSARSAVLGGGAVLVMAFFASGGGVLLLRLIRIIRPAPPYVAEIVEQLAKKMEVPGRIKVFELEWAQVNAVAWPVYRAVGFSRPLLDKLAADEVRSIAAHELGHLLEPQWVRAVRLVHMFAYLLVPPVIKYGGTWAPAGLALGGRRGDAIGWLLLITTMLAYRRFTRRMEERADRMQSAATADPGTYMRSLIKIHEGNLCPAVMPGAQTHPHLYDRLLAGGVLPEFPRPKAPSRARPLLAAVGFGILAMLAMFLTIVAAGCCRQLLSGGH